MSRILIKHLFFFFLVLGQISMAQSYDGNGDLKKCEALISQNRHKEAQKILIDILSKNSDNPRANLLLGKSYLAENNYASASERFEVSYLYESRTSFENLILYSQTAKQNGDYIVAEKYLDAAVKTPGLNYKQKKLIDNITNGINDVKNGSFKEYVNDLNQFSGNTSGSELAPYPIDSSSFSYGHAVKTLDGLSVDNFLAEGDNITKLEINPLLGRITNIQYYNDIAYLTICNDGLCKLFSATYNKNYRLKNIKEIKELNEKFSSSTQAFVFKLKNTDVMLFSSNRASSQGGYDIYLTYRQREQWSFPKKISNSINTVGDEISPFYDGQYLYFSSNFHPNMGGFDIFKSQTKSFISFGEVENIGSPFNSVANDLYFKLFPSGGKGILSSNRIGSIEGSSATCCNDIYEFPWPPRLLDKPKSPLTVNVVGQKDKDYYNNIIEELKALLPLTLYFHNDIPYPNQKVPTYSNTYFPYKRMEKEYLSENFSTNNKSFFNNTLPLEYSKLQAFTSLIQEVFKSDLEIQFTVRGFASPLATKKYNDALSQRRINSFINELFAYKSGLFEAYRSNISINQLPFGETKSAGGVSDDRRDPKNSVYAFEALRERKIEIVNIQKKSDAIPAETLNESGNRDLTETGITVQFSDSIKRTAKAHSSYTETESGFRKEKITVRNPYSEIFTIEAIEASCGCTEVDASDQIIPGDGSITIIAKREVTNGSVKPVTIRFISSNPKAQPSFIIPLD